MNNHCYSNHDVTHILQFIISHSLNNLTINSNIKRDDILKFQNEFTCLLISKNAWNQANHAHKSSSQSNSPQSKKKMKTTPGRLQCKLQLHRISILNQQQESAQTDPYAACHSSESMPPTSRKSSTAMIALPIVLC